MRKARKLIVLLAGAVPLTGSVLLYTKPYKNTHITHITKITLFHQIIMKPHSAESVLRLI
jgi:hypothetical protein